MSKNITRDPEDLEAGWVAVGDHGFDTFSSSLHGLGVVIPFEPFFVLGNTTLKVGGEINNVVRLFRQIQCVL